MTIEVMVTPKVIARHKSLARSLVEDGKILTANEVADKTLTFLFGKIAARLRADFAAFAA